MGALTRNAGREYNYIGVSEEQRHSITISGEGKVIGVPDVANIQLGYSVEKPTVAAAQKDNSEKMNAIIKKLKDDFKIDEKDIKTTNYNIYPQYNWNDGRQNLRGYQVSQNVSVKVRDLDQVSSILDAAGSLGLNQIGSLNFEIDDPEKLKQEAREQAIEAAKEKAENLADVAGVKLGRIISFYESSSSPVDYYRSSYKLEADMATNEEAAPQIEVGSSEITITATVEYEIL